MQNKMLIAVRCSNERMGVKSTGHAGGLGLFFFHRGRRANAVCGGQQWSLDRDMMLLII